MIEDISCTKKLPALHIFTSVIRYFRDLLEENLKGQFTNKDAIETADIFWVLTVPAIWGLKAKCFMREAAENVSNITYHSVH